ncbi:hypothetical protein [Desulfocurvibacter africanus]|uniref:hypothetical protein n=1 Tax=Desulfocurvibacter africanus TaxID=873 RepID=UPI00110C43EE|nr:hypothetical protein [Desulfocurvibacter africanus]
MLGKYSCLLVLTILTFPACARLKTDFEYVKPVQQQSRTEIERQYPYPMNIVWHSLVEHLGQLPLNQMRIDKDSSVIRIEQQTEDPSGFVDCGSNTYTVNRRSGLPFFRRTSLYSQKSIPAVANYAEYEKGEGRRKSKYQQRTALKITSTIKVNPIASELTNVSVASTYLLVIDTYISMRGGYHKVSGRSYTISQFGNHGDTGELTCISTNYESSSILNGIEEMIHVNVGRLKN